MVLRLLSKLNILSLILLYDFNINIRCRVLKDTQNFICNDIRKLRKTFALYLGGFDSAAASCAASVMTIKTQACMRNSTIAS